MDTSAAKRQNRNTKQGTNTIECIRSLEDFPDEILQHLLSFLPTKCAVGTSMLLKRWENLWTHLPNLDFHEGSIANRRQFMNFTDKVLIHSDNFHIKKFSLSCSVKTDTSRVNAWITSGVMRNAQEFDICLDDVIETWVLPHCLFRCKTLKIFKLSFPNILKLPSESCFPNLKILTLENITLSDELSTDLLFAGSTLEELSLIRVTFLSNYGRELIFSGPELATLVIDNCNLEKIWSIKISAPKLWKLTLHDYSENENLRSFDLMLKAPSVRVLNCCGVWKVHCFFSQGSSLVMASIDIPSFCKESTLVADSVVYFFREFAFVNHIKISINVIEVLAHAPSDTLANIPNLYMTFLEFGPEPVDLKSNVVEKILLKCRRLEHVINAGDIVSYSKKKRPLAF